MPDSEEKRLASEYKNFKDISYTGISNKKQPDMFYMAYTNPSRIPDRFSQELSRLQFGQV